MSGTGSSYSEADGKTQLMTLYWITQSAQCTVCLRFFIKTIKKKRKKRGKTAAEAEKKTNVLVFFFF